MLRNKPNKTFRFLISADVELASDEIWFDGEKPEEPTVRDVLAVIATCGGKHSVIRDWGLENDMTITVSDGTDSKVVP